MKIVFLSLIILLNFGCNYSSVEETKLNPLPQNIISPTPTPQNRKFEISDFAVYSQVLTGVVYSSTLGYISGYDWLTVRKETIAPENPEEIKPITDLPEDLIKDFIEKNKSKEKLGKGYDVKILHDVVEQKGSLETFFNLEKKKHPKLNAIMGLSRIGFNGDKTQSLVYVEYFNPEKQLMKKYCLINWKREGQSLEVESVKWF